MMASLWIALGSALGGIARYLLSTAVAERFGESFPWGTLAVNILGSLLIGLLAGLTDPSSRMLVPPAMRQFLIIGLMGGFTTFSSFSLQTLNLLRDGELLLAVANVLGSVLLCLVAAALGLMAALRIAS